MPAEPYKHKVTRHVGPDGRRCKSTGPGARRVQEETATYYGDLPPLPPATRPERVSLETTDLGAAWVELRRRLALRRRELEGIADPVLGQARKGWTEHLQEWRANLQAVGTSGKHIEQMCSRLTTLAEVGGWVRLSDVTGDSAVKALARLKAQRTTNMPERYQERSAQTRNHYLSHLKQFLRWAARDGRVVRSPVEGLTPGSVEMDRRHDRRCPTSGEITRLLDYLGGPRVRVRAGMSGAQRALAYQVAMATGLRGGEVRSLTRESFDLDQGTLTVRAGYSKHRRKDTQPLPAWLVEDLQAWFAQDGGLWGNFHPKRPGRQLKADVLAAGIPFEVEGPDGPLYFDFHALRVWYCTALAALPGIAPKTLMDLCRHSSAQLTLAIYAKSQEHAARAAVGQIAQPATQPRLLVG